MDREFPWKLPVVTCCVKKLKTRAGEAEKGAFVTREARRSPSQKQRRLDATYPRAL